MVIASMSIGSRCPCKRRYAGLFVSREHRWHRFPPASRRRLFKDFDIFDSWASGEEAENDP